MNQPLCEKNRVDLFRKAAAMKELAYAPYSNFSVGAALLAEDGTIFTGCNVETAAFSGICAERTALVKAISQGVKQFTAIAVSGSSGAPTPCGVCRQMLNEFAPDLLIIWGEDENNLQMLTLSEMLPYAFGPMNLS